MTQSELLEILERHRKWLAKESDGRPADLHGADLCYTNLSEANLHGANLTGDRRTIMGNTRLVME